MDCKMLFVSFGIKETDGRLNELKKVADLVCSHDEIYMTYRDAGINNNLAITIKGKYLGINNYCRFIKKAYFEMVKKHYDILFVDNFFAAAVGLLAKLNNKEIIIIQDCREFYEIKNVSTIIGKILVFLENILIKKSDIVIAANEERSLLMKEKYNLVNKPLVFENVRFLNFDNKQKHKNIYDKSKCNVISTGGVSVERGGIALIKAFSKLDSKYCLYVFGGGNKDDIKTANKTIKECRLANRVKIMNKVSLQELKYYIHEADIGIVHYHRKDMNNEYCASGKVYEYIGEGIPIVTTENPPLKRICEELCVGLSDESFYKGIEKVYTNYEYYKSNAIRQSRIISPKNNNERLAKQIKERVRIIYQERGVKV